MRHKSEELMKQIMDYAEQFQLLNHRSPYTSEIADALGIVKSTVYKYLVAMNDRGMLSYRNGEIVTERTNKISLLTKPAAQLTADATGKTVYAGPGEATAIGNLLAQMIYAEELTDLKSARQCVRDSFEIKTFVPAK